MVFSHDRISVPTDDSNGAALEEALTEVVTGPPSFAECNGVSYDKSQQACCGGELYSLTSEGCCGNQTVYAFAQQGCCNQEHVFTYGIETCSAAPSSSEETAQFTCGADWPPESYSSYWRRYCAAGQHMAWAMTASCNVGWLSVQQSSLEQAEAKALEACNKKAAAFNGETCTIFDRDGSQCRRQRCGTEIYDASVKTCCGGRVIDRVLQGCCGGVVFEAQSQGCCQGRVYSKASYSCCGGKVLYDAEARGCCLENGPQAGHFPTCCLLASAIPASRSTSLACRIVAGIQRVSVPFDLASIRVATDLGERACKMQTTSPGSESFRIAFAMTRRGHL
ncbi:abh1 [Symbiodinium pilosum]|uniref:Abh1 protein n=1 Tax=Symbiodinium pilosum TaxID=2952 RepID=A0A812ILE1_SYMPI|nr:abh1 [Symbiodinium pilosum]